MSAELLAVTSSVLLNLIKIDIPVMLVVLMQLVISTSL